MTAREKKGSSGAEQEAKRRTKCGESELGSCYTDERTVSSNDGDLRG